MSGGALRIPKTIRCMSILQDGQWVAVSLEFGLAVQGESEGEVRAKLEAQIADHVQFAQREAATDLKFAEQLLAQRAPADMYLAWYVAHAYLHFRRLFPRGHRPAPSGRKPFRENPFSLMAA